MRGLDGRARPDKPNVLAHKFRRANDFMNLTALLRNFVTPTHLVLRRREAASKDAPGSATEATC
jgi:hypothetical protein